MNKKQLLWSCVLALVLLLPEASLANQGGSPPGQAASFRTVGYTTSYRFRTLPHGYTQFDLTSEGDGSTPTMAYGVSGVTGVFSGSFTLQEWGLVDFDPETGEGSGRGVNGGILTIVDDQGGRLVIGFQGQSTFESVSGRFTILRGTGAHRGLRGWGRYSGVPDLCSLELPPGPDTCTGFYVDFTFARGP